MNLTTKTVKTWTERTRVWPALSREVLQFYLHLTTSQYRVTDKFSSQERKKIVFKHPTTQKTTSIHGILSHNSCIFGRLVIFFCFNEEWTIGQLCWELPQTIMRTFISQLTALFIERESTTKNQRFFYLSKELTCAE